MGISEGVKNIQVGAKRVGLPFFTHWSDSDEKGCFEIKHKFYNKAKIFIKFKSSTCDIKVMHNGADLVHYTFARIAEMLTKNGPNFNGIEIQLPWSNNLGSFDFRNWIAATVNNSVHDFGDFTSKEGISSVSGDLKILIDPWAMEMLAQLPCSIKWGISLPFSIQILDGWLHLVSLRLAHFGLILVFG